MSSILVGLGIGAVLSVYHMARMSAKERRRRAARESRAREG